MDMDEELSRYQRRKLDKARQMLARERGQRWQSGLRLLFLAVAMGLIGYFGWRWLTTPRQPKSGEEVKEMGREHVTNIKDVVYNSNPPTSGPHFSTWAKKGVYDRVLSDGYLIHSLEHGYIVISYHCDEPESGWVRRVLAHEGETVMPASDSAGLDPLYSMTFKPEGKMSVFTPDKAPEGEELPSAFEREECQAVVEKLQPFVERYERVIVVPRINMEVPIAVTAWGRIDKLDEFDEERIERFIKAYHNQGPEKTIE